MLTVQGVTSQRKNKCYVWECLCDCGKTTYQTTSALNSGNSKSCGCYSYNFIDLTGQRFGRLVVVKLSDLKTGKRNQKLWECQCDCGKTAYVTSHSLRKGYTTSCGCYISIKQFVDLTGRKVGRLTVLKLSDTKLGKSIAWDCLCDCGKMTKVRMDGLKYETTKSCGCYGREINIKSLKAVSDKRHIEGTYIPALGGKIRANNVSGTTGVSYDSSRNMWCAAIVFKKKTYHLGRYKKKDDAIKARKEAEDRLHGDFLEWYQNEYNSK